MGYFYGKGEGIFIFHTRSIYHHLEHVVFAKTPTSLFRLFITLEVTASLV
jgi:hypothetical protein